MKIISPSQWTNLPWFAISLIAVWLGVYWLLLLTLGMIYHTHKWTYQFTDTGVIETKGILSITHREIPYYRIKSVKLDEPLWMRFFGISNVTVLSSDPFHPELKLHGVRYGKQVTHELREVSDQHRDKRGVKELDIYNLNK